MSLCKKCGATHGMGIEDMTTGIVTPIDHCRDCLFAQCTIEHPKEPISLEELCESSPHTLGSQLENTLRQLIHCHQPDPGDNPP